MHYYDEHVREVNYNMQSLRENTSWIEQQILAFIFFSLVQVGEDVT